MPTKLEKAKEAMRSYALGLPEAYEEFPWGERVAKVKKKVFVFLGASGDFGMSVKLPESGFAALELPFTEPTGYGLGKAGWVSIRFSKGESPPEDLLREWILESYRAVAPKKLVASLGAAPPEPTKKPAKESSKPKPKARKKGA